MKRLSWMTGVVALCALAESGAVVLAATTPACDQAVTAFEARFKTRSDDAALTAAKALDAQCTGSDAARARAVSRQGVVLFRRKDFEGARAAFQSAAKFNPTDASLRMNICAVETEAGRHEEAIAACVACLDLAKAQDDGSEKKHEDVLELGFNLALAKVRSTRRACSDHTVFEMFDAFRKAHPDHAWVYQLVGAWVWDCDKDFDKGLALYKKSCDLGWQPACEQVKYTEECMCKTRQPG